MIKGTASVPKSHIFTRNCERNFKRISITEDQLDQVMDFATEVAKVKSKEFWHQKDNQGQVGRNASGKGAEVAFENFIGQKFVDWQIGSSKNFNVPDLRVIGIEAGLKCATYGGYPMVRKDPKYSEVIMLRITDLDYFICGYGNTDVIRKHQDIKYVISSGVLANGEKSAFIGFDYLEQFYDYKDLLQVDKNYLKSKQ